MSINKSLAVPVRQLETCDCCERALEETPGLLMRRESGYWDLICEACTHQLMLAAHTTVQAQAAQDASKSL